MSKNQYANALATLGSQIAFEGGSASVEIKKWRESIIEILKDKFLEKEDCRSNSYTQGAKC